MSTEHDTIRKIEPTLLWNAFVDLNAVPRGSKKEEAVTRFVAERGKRLGLETKVDPVGNVLIKKPGTKGFEGHAPVVLQSHIDMVWQKNSDTQFDFETQGIEMFRDGDFVKAKGTTLGADNGIGVATIFSVLESDSIPHPPLECLFTIDEETGMTGAKELDPSWLQGKVLLNLDTEEDTELTIGCAGGANVTANGTYTPETLPSSIRFDVFKISIRGLTGGHSGVDIHLGRANANKLMNRLLFGASKKFGLRVHSVEGGSLRNAIPRESFSQVSVPTASASAFQAWVAFESKTMRMENSLTDPNMVVAVEPISGSEASTLKTALPQAMQDSLLSAVAGVVSGIERMSPSIAGLVQTSNNLARVKAKDGTIAVLCLARSSVDSERVALSESLGCVLGQLGGNVEVDSEYPGWQPLPKSNIVQLMQRLYEEQFHHPPHVAACHAGLECGIIGSKFPGMEMISFGPNITGAHSPDEKVQISSVQKFYGFFLKTLASL